MRAHDDARTCPDWPEKCFCDVEKARAAELAAVRADFAALRAEVGRACMDLSGATRWATDGTNVERLAKEAFRLVLAAEDQAASLRAQLSTARASALEEAARVVEAECARVLSKQTGAPVRSEGYAVDAQLRMTVVLLPDLATTIRSLLATPGETE